MKLPLKFPVAVTLGLALLGLLGVAGSLMFFRSAPPAAPTASAPRIDTAAERAQPASPSASTQPARKNGTAPQTSSPARAARRAQTIPPRAGESPSAPEEARWLETRAPGAENSEDEGEGERRGRDDWFYEQRAYPQRTIPVNARGRALQQLEQLEERRRQFSATDLGEAATAAATLPAWESLGPRPIGQGQTYGLPRVSVSGRISAITLHPNYNGTTNQTVYLGTAQGGVWRSTDNGTTWTTLTDNQPSLAIGDIAIDPLNPNNIYVGTGEGNMAGDVYYGAGLLKSTDGGASWTVITGPTSTTFPNLPAFVYASFTRLAIDPVNPATLYACTVTGRTYTASGGGSTAPLGQRGVWKSTDSGQTWRNLDPTGSGGMNSGTDIIIDPLNNNRLYAGILGQGVYRSTNGGETSPWEKLAGGLPTSGFSRIALAVGPPLSPSTDRTLYAAIGATNSDLMGIYKSTDKGDTWTQVTRPQQRGQANYNLAIVVDPVDANIVYYGTSANSSNNAGTFWRSTDGGQSWTDQSTGNGSTGGLHADHHAIVVSPANRNIVFSGNDGGVWRSGNATDLTMGWTSLNQTLSITQFQGVALHPTDPNILIGGTQDNGTNRYNGNLSWTHVRGGDGGFALIDQSNPQVMYHTFFNQNNAGGSAQIGPEISFNSGNSWTRRGCFGCSTAQGNFNPADRVGFYAPMAQHTAFTGASGNVLYFGTHRLYRTADQGVTWTGLGSSSDSFGADLTKGSGRLSAITAHPVLGSGDPPAETVWIGTSDGNVQFTTNAGLLASATFTNVTKAPLPNRFVTDIALDPTNQQRAIVTFSGFNLSTPSTPGHVFLTTDQGGTWTDISGDLPDVPVTSIALDPARANTYYIGTDLGVFRSTNGGANWVRLDNGMPKVATFMVRYHEASGNLYAATHGRGIYRLSVANPSASVHGASFSSGLARDAIASIFGTNLATGTQAAASLPLPTSLAGASVKIRDSAGVERAASLFFASPNQINCLIPPGTASGTATVIITSQDGTVSIGTIQIAAVAPGLFTASSNGQGVAAAVAVRVKADGTQTAEPVAQFNGGQWVSLPIDLGPPGETIVLLLFGTGIRHRSNLSAVSVTIGGVAAQVDFAGAQSDFAGLDQLNVRIPRSLAGRGEVDIVLTVDGKVANTIKINIK
jgi:uncharacterized protein (TIGR03437 family)